MIFTDLYLVIFGVVLGFKDYGFRSVVRFVFSKYFIINLKVLFFEFM